MSKAQGQFTIIDYNDALTLTGYIGSNLAKTQMYNPDNDTYNPDWKSKNLVLTPSLYVIGTTTDQITSTAVTSVKWYVGSSTTAITSAGNYALSGAKSHILTVKANVMAGQPGIDYRCVITYKDASTGLSLTHSSYDFHLQIQDKLGSLSSLDLYYTVPQGTPLIALRKKKVGINNPNPAAALDVVGDVRINNSPIADYVIQQGTSGIWTYRKWKSGVAECWGQYTFTTTCQTAWGVLYESDAVSPPSFPFTFASAPQVHVNPANGTYAMIVEMGTGTTGPTTTSPGKIYVVRPKSQASGSYKVSIYVIGKV